MLGYADAKVKIIHVANGWCMVYTYIQICGKGSEGQALKKTKQNQAQIKQ